MKAKNNKAIELTDEQAIDAIYDILQHTSYGEKIKREPLDINQVGKFGIINPGPKNFNHVLKKLFRKIKTKTDAENKTTLSDVVNRDYHNNEEKLFDKISDWTRFAIIIPNYESAPAILGSFLGEFGGEMTCHNREDYKAIHLHTKYKDVNIEFQFHTKAHAELKKVTDIFYHEYNNIVVEKNSAIEDEKIETQNKMEPYCRMVYNRSGFNENLPAIQNIYKEYQSRKPFDPKEHEPKLKRFCEYYSKAYLIQEELSQYLTLFLTKLNDMENLQDLSK